MRGSESDIGVGNDSDGGGKGWKMRVMIRESSEMTGEDYQEQDQSENQSYFCHIFKY